MSENTNARVHEVTNKDGEIVAYTGQLTKSGKSVAWEIGQWGGTFTPAQSVNVFTSAEVPALRAGAYNLANNQIFERQDGSKSYPQAFLARQIKRSLALTGRKDGFEVWEVPGLAVKGTGFDKWLSLDSKAIVSEKIGRSGAAQILADRIAQALTKGVYINVPKFEKQDGPAPNDIEADDVEELPVF